MIIPTSIFLFSGAGIVTVLLFKIHELRLQKKILLSHLSEAADRNLLEGIKLFLRHSNRVSSKINRENVKYVAQIGVALALKGYVLWKRGFGKYFGKWVDAVRGKKFLKKNSL